MGRLPFYILITLVGVVAYMAYMHHVSTVASLSTATTSSTATTKPSAGETDAPAADTPEQTTVDVERYSNSPREVVLEDQRRRASENFVAALVKDTPITTSVDAPRMPSADQPTDTVIINGDDASATELEALRNDVKDIKKSINLLMQKMAKEERPLYETFFT